MTEMEQNNWKRNDTSRFVLPTIGLTKDEVITNSFVGCYIGLSTLPEEKLNKARLYIVYREPNQKVELISKSKQTIGNYIVYEYYNSCLHDIISRFLKGEYSKLSNEIKLKILTFWGLDKTSRLAAILYPADYAFEIGISKSSLAKVKEIWPIPKVENELFNPEI